MNLFFLLFQEGGGSSLFLYIPLFAIIYAIFYFLLIKPQRKQQEEIKSMVAELKAGDEVVTTGGIVGKIKEVRDTSFIVQSAEKSFLEIAKSAVVGRKPADEK